MQYADTTAADAAAVTAAIAAAAEAAAAAAAVAAIAAAISRVTIETTPEAAIRGITYPRNKPLTAGTTGTAPIAIPHLEVTHDD